MKLCQFVPILYAVVLVCLWLAWPQANCYFASCSDSHVPLYHLYVGIHVPESKGKAQRMLCSKGVKGAEFCFDLIPKGATSNTVIKLI